MYGFKTATCCAVLSIGLAATTKNLHSTTPLNQQVDVQYVSSLLGKFCFFNCSDREEKNECRRYFDLPDYLAKGLDGVNNIYKNRPKNETGEQEGDNGQGNPKVSSVVIISASTCLLLSALLHQTQEKKVKVTELMIYPIKSCSGQRLKTAKVTAQGFEGDRIAQLVDDEGEYYADEYQYRAELLKLKATIEGTVLTVSAPAITGMDDLKIDLAKASKEPVTVPEYDWSDVEDFCLDDYGDEAAEWFEEALDGPLDWEDVRLAGIGKDYDRFCRFIEEQGDPLPTKSKKPPLSLADEAPYLLTNMASLRDLNRRLKARGKEPVDMRRMRGNICVDGLKPWEEDSLGKIRIGQVEFWVWQRCGRCKMVTVNNDTLKHGPEPLATLNTFRERLHGMRNFGMHLIPVEGGIRGDALVSEGDEIEILEYHNERRKEWERLFSKSGKGLMLRKFSRQHG